MQAAGPPAVHTLIVILYTFQVRFRNQHQSTRTRTVTVEEHDAAAMDPRSEPWIRGNINIFFQGTPQKRFPWHERSVSDAVRLEIRWTGCIDGGCWCFPQILK